MKIKINDKCLLWNQVIKELGRSWGGKKKMFDLSKEMTHWAIYQTPNTKLIRGRVDIFVTARYKTKHRRDSDGVCTKAIIDTLVTDGILIDDCTKYVRRVSTEAQIGCDKDEIIIELKKI